MQVKTSSIVFVFIFFLFIVTFSFIDRMDNKNYRETSIEIIRELNSTSIDSIYISSLNTKFDSLSILISNKTAISEFVDDLKTIDDYSGNFGKITGSVLKYKMVFYEEGVIVFNSILLFKKSSAAIFVDIKEDGTDYSLNNIVPHNSLKRNFENLKEK